MTILRNRKIWRKKKSKWHCYTTEGAGSVIGARALRRLGAGTRARNWSQLHNTVLNYILYSILTWFGCVVASQPGKSGLHWISQLLPHLTCSFCLFMHDLKNSKYLWTLLAIRAGRRDEFHRQRAIGAFGDTSTDRLRKSLYNCPNWSKCRHVALAWKTDATPSYALYIHLPHA